MFFAVACIGPLLQLACLPIQYIQRAPTKNKADADAPVGARSTLGARSREGPPKAPGARGKSADLLRLPRLLPVG